VPTARKRTKPLAPRKRAAPPGAALADAIEATLADGKAEDVTRIDLAGKTSIADFMIVASGRSGRQVAALADRLLAMLKERGQKRVPIEGLAGGDWILVDAGDVIVHLFRPEIRARYNLEKMWGAAFGDEPAPELE